MEWLCRIFWMITLKKRRNWWRQSLWATRMSSNLLLSLRWEWCTCMTPAEVVNGLLQLNDFFLLLIYRMFWSYGESMIIFSPWIRLMRSRSKWPLPSVLHLYHSWASLLSYELQLNEWFQASRREGEIRNYEGYGSCAAGGGPRTIQCDPSELLIRYS